MDSWIDETAVVKQLLALPIELFQVQHAQDPEHLKSMLTQFNHLVTRYEYNKELVLRRQKRS